MATTCLHILFGIFLLFFIKKNCDFIILLSDFDEVLNFRNGILTNWRHEIVSGTLRLVNLEKYKNIAPAWDVITLTLDR